MRVIRSLDAIDPARFDAGSAVAIGKFDGVHLGHRAIIGRMCETAAARDCEAVVFTFTNNPLSLLRPAVCPQALMSPQQRLEAIAALGVDTCVMVDFDEALAAVSAEEFVADVLVETLHSKHISLGGDFRFGHGGAGDAELLGQLGRELGFDVDVVDWVEVPGVGKVSSSRIREAVLAGDVAAAARMLGRPLAVRGEVVRGDARGKELGFPTANLGGEIEGLVPADGVYAGRVTLPSGSEHPAAISVGNNPTFTPEGRSRVEPYLLDFDGDLYGQRIEVSFVEWVRGMESFDSLDALIARIRADVEQTRSLLES